MSITYSAPRLLAALGLVATTAWSPDLAGAAIPEPHTVFYGRIVGTGSARPFAVLDGGVEWSIGSGTGHEVRLAARVRPLGDTEFSYRLNVPHHALAPGLSSGGGLALKAGDETHVHLDIRVNGLPAAILGPAGATFSTAQIRRAATYRLDLAVGLEAADEDGDGLPDDWAAAHALAGGANADEDGDGLSNGEEYRLGTDPKRDDRTPSLQTREVLAYAGGTTGLPLVAVDADTPPEGLGYEVTRPPAAGRLWLRNALADPGAPDGLLEAGGRFTQADVLDGRVVYTHEDGAAEGDSFAVRLGDELVGRFTEAEVGVRFFQPAEDRLTASAPPLPAELMHGSQLVAAVDPDAELRLENFRLSREGGFVICDWSEAGGDLDIAAPSAEVDAAAYESQYVGRFGRDRRHVLMTGGGRNNVAGGMEADVLVARGVHNTLRGNAGADRFLLVGSREAEDDLLDFRPAEGDVLDLTRVLSGESLDLEDYLRLDEYDGGVVLGLDRRGTGGGYLDRLIRLVGLSAGDVDLNGWLDMGTLLAGDRSLVPRVSVAAWGPAASEIGPETGEFQLVRTGTVGEELTVAIRLAGSAVNGTDYATVDSSVRFAAGSRRVAVVVQPYADGIPEPSETVELTVLPGEGYEVAGDGSAALTIEDARARFSLSVLEPVATLEPLLAGAIRVTSPGPVDRPLEVLLEIGGTAVPGVHYESLRRVVPFAIGQSSATLSVTPIPGAVLDRGAASVFVRLLPDPAYDLGPSPAARVLLMNRSESFAAWRERHFPDLAGSLEALGGVDPGSLGVPLLRRYAFGLDPHQPDRNVRPRVRVRDGHLSVDVPRAPGAVDVQPVLEVSSDLLHWSTGPDRVEEVPPAAGDPAGVVCYRALPALGEMPRQFVRVRLVPAQ